MSNDEFVEKIAEAGEVVGDKFHDLETGLADNNKLLIAVNDKLDSLIIDVQTLLSYFYSK